MNNIEPIKKITGAKLQGYKRVQVKNAPYPAIYETNDMDEVEGILYYISSLKEIELLDIFESSVLYIWCVS